MSDSFKNKDYGEYFSALEKDIYKKSVQNSETQVKRTVNKHRKFKGGVFKLRPWVFVAVLSIIAVVVVICALPKGSKTDVTAQTPQNASQVENIADSAEEQKVDLFADKTDRTAVIGEDIVSKNVIVVNCDTNEVVASRGADQRCYPASTTKIMTVLTAVDYITDYDKTFTFSFEITDPLYIAEATVAGFSAGEAVNMTDLLYGAILPSGADATVGLALTISGSEEEFVKLMNKKAQQLGLKNTHFVNSSGLFDQNHYTTPEDMAVILRAAMQNDLCRKILSTYQYTTAPTPQHPDGILLTSTLFSHMYGTEPEGADILGGKTGFVNESGYCIASFGKSDGGTEYVCVTLGGNGLWPTVYDQFHLYEQYAK